MARASAVAPSVNHKAAVDSGITMMAMSTPRASALYSTIVRGRACRESAPTSHTLAITIGTATKATYSETLFTPMWNSSTRYMG